MATLAVYAIVHHTPDSNVWGETVRVYPWFTSRSTLSSSPPSPTTEKGPEVPLQHPRPKPAFDPAGLTRPLSPLEYSLQPLPTFDQIPQPSYQHPQRRYEGLHFAATQDPDPVGTDAFVQPREAPRPPVRAQSLYPEHLQFHLSTETRNNLYNHSRQSEGQEPSPIGDWPRGSRSNRYNKRLPPPPRPRINTEANALRQQPLSSVSSDQRMGLSGLTYVPSPASHGLGSPKLGPQSAAGSVRRLPPPPLNLDGISNKYGTRR